MVVALRVVAALRRQSHAGPRVLCDHDAQIRIKDHAVSGLCAPLFRHRLQQVPHGPVGGIPGSPASEPAQIRVLRSQRRQLFRSGQPSHAGREDGIGTAPMGGVGEIGPGVFVQPEIRDVLAHALHKGIPGEIRRPAGKIADQLQTVEVGCARHPPVARPFVAAPVRGIIGGEPVQEDKGAFQRPGPPSVVLLA